MLLDYGIYYPVVRGQSGVATTASGHINLISSVAPYEQTDVVCARLGAAFGFRYSLVEPVPQTATLRVVYATPPIVGPSGVAVRDSSHPTVIRPGEKHISTYGFDYSYELVAGDWRITVMQAERVLLTRTFHVRTDCPPI